MNPKKLIRGVGILTAHASAPRAGTSAPSSRSSLDRGTWPGGAKRAFSPDGAGSIPARSINPRGLVYATGLWPRAASPGGVTASA